MPTYEYECLTCGLLFEVRQSFSEKALEVCDCARQGKVERQMGRGEFLVKGDSKAPAAKPSSSLSVGAKSRHSCSPYCKH